MQNKFLQTVLLVTALSVPAAVQAMETGGGGGGDGLPLDPVRKGTPSKLTISASDVARDIGSIIEPLQKYYLQPRSRSQVHPLVAQSGKPLWQLGQIKKILEAVDTGGDRTLWCPEKKRNRLAPRVEEAQQYIDKLKIVYDSTESGDKVAEIGTALETWERIAPQVNVFANLEVNPRRKIYGPPMDLTQEGALSKLQADASAMLEQITGISSALGAYCWASNPESDSDAPEDATSVLSSLKKVGKTPLLQLGHIKYALELLSQGHVSALWSHEEKENFLAPRVEEAQQYIDGIENVYDRAKLVVPEGEIEIIGTVLKTWKESVSKLNEFANIDVDPRGKASKRAK